MSSDNVKIFQFDSFYLNTHPKHLEELSLLYCRTWKYDKNFGEYQKCSKCVNKYYSEDYVVNQKKTTCEKCGSPLKEAWVPEEVQRDILADSSTGENFFGVLALDLDENMVVGFSWGIRKELSEITYQKILPYLHSPSGFIPYYNEIGLEKSYRGKGIGGRMCRLVVEWMQREFPNTSAYLRTHIHSFAHPMFKKAGFEYVFDDTEVGGGRIYMSANDCSFLTPQNFGD